MLENTLDGCVQRVKAMQRDGLRRPVSPTGRGVGSVVAEDAVQKGDAVCAVDWGWIVGSTIAAASLADGTLRLTLDPAGPLTVSAATWQGAPLLAFQPYREPG